MLKLKLTNSHECTVDDYNTVSDAEGFPHSTTGIPTPPPTSMILEVYNKKFQAKT